MTGLLDGLRWRLVGPFRAGRSVAVAGHPADRLTFYFGSTGGGVWKTTDAGQSWHNVSDGFFRRASVGALAVSEADPNVIYAGMGEACLRNTVSHGDGVYRSADGGRTWVHRGLAETRHIGRVRVDPRDPARVYVAALGHAHGPNPERGVYRSADGGATWEHVLDRGPDAGAVDLCLDRANPRRLYAATWQVRRLPWRLDSGGEGSGLWRSDDGGDSWVELSGRPGLPKGPLGRIGVAAAPAREGRVWAIVEAEDGGVYRSDDFGEHWLRLSEQWDLRWRPFYYSHIFADPADPDTVWALANSPLKSVDAGKTFAKVPQQHGDNHDLWIDPNEPGRLILGHDGGASVSLDGGQSWSPVLNQPTAELYHVTTDTRQPYRVYASQQDNSSLSLATQSEAGAITGREFYPVGGGESGYIAVDPRDPDIVFATDYNGEATRYDHRTRTAESIWVWPDWRRGGGAADERYRFNWTTPLLISPHDPDLLYIAGNLIFASRDQGHTWEPVSPDLTRNDPDKLRSSGLITAENIGAEYWCTVFALAESPLQRGLLWAGTDDGLVHVSEDAGGSWREVTPRDLPDWTVVSILEPSPHDPAACYLAAENHRQDDFAPCLLRTADLGATWQRIDAGIPDGEFCRVIRADPARARLLYAGTEAGVYVSYDDGGSWRSCRGNLPVAPVHDLHVKGDELVAATHGRSIWILDELPALRAGPAPRESQAGDSGRAGGEREHASEDTAHSVRVYPTHPLVRWAGQRDPGSQAKTGKAEGGPRRSIAWAFGVANVAVLHQPVPGRDESEARLLDSGSNPPAGAVILYELPEPGDQELTITILDDAGTEIRRFTTTPRDEEPKRDRERDKERQPEPPHPPRRAGLNRFTWDGAHAPATKIVVDAADEDFIDEFAPAALPGTYQVRVRLGDSESSASLEIRLDPRNEPPREAVEDRHRLLLRAYRQWSALNEAVNRLRRIEHALGRWIPEREAASVPAAGAPGADRPGTGVDDANGHPEEGSQAVGEPGGDLAAAAAELREMLTGIEDQLTATGVKGCNLERVISTRLVRLDLRLAVIILMLAEGVGAVPTSTREVAEDLIDQVGAGLGRFAEALDGPVADFDRRLREAGVSLLDRQVP
jgi:photosystem II stability/assembly factor-like uncharacterized protein